MTDAQQAMTDEAKAAVAEYQEKLTAYLKDPMKVDGLIDALNAKDHANFMIAITDLEPQMIEDAVDFRPSWEIDSEIRHLRLEAEAKGEEFDRDAAVMKVLTGKRRQGTDHNFTSANHVKDVLRARAEALIQVNEFREQLSLPPLEKLPPAIVGNAQECVVAKALTEGDYRATVGGTGRVVVRRKPTAEELEVEPYLLDDPDAWPEALVTDVDAYFIDAFDNHHFKDLDITRVQFYEGEKADAT